MTTTDIIDGALFPAHLKPKAIEAYDDLAAWARTQYAETVLCGRPDERHRADAERFQRNADALRNDGPIVFGRLT